MIPVEPSLGSVVAVIVISPLQFAVVSVLMMSSAILISPTRGALSPNPGPPALYAVNLRTPLPPYNLVQTAML